MTDRPPKSVALCDLPTFAGSSLGMSGYVHVTQDRINSFAEATDDHQWIHVDPERAKDGPFGTTIAHGFLTLSLAPALFWQLIDVTGTDQVINCGVGRAKFTLPVPVDSYVGLSADITSVESCRGGYQVTAALTFIVENAERPACVAEMIVRYLGDVDA